MVLDMCQRVLQDDRQTEKEARTAAQLAMVVLHHCKGRVDEYIPPMLVMISERVKTVSDTEKTCWIIPPHTRLDDTRKRYAHKRNAHKRKMHTRITPAKRYISGARLQKHTLNTYIHTLVVDGDIDNTHNTSNTRELNLDE